MKKIILLLLLSYLVLEPVFAEDFDTSVDESIRKEYVDNLSLPPLPSVSPVSNGAEKNIKTAGKNAVSSAAVHKTAGKTYTVKHGTKIDLISNSQINDWMKKGQIVSFYSDSDFRTKEGITVPAQTVFRGRITDTHRPQLGANGGLVELCIDEINFNGFSSKINTKIVLANSKRIFRNDIKGTHTYWKNFYKISEPGRKVYNAASTCANVLLPIPVVNIFAIIPWSAGAVVYTVNFALSPFIAIFTKGGSLSLPQGTRFTIKFIENTQIKG